MQIYITANVPITENGSARLGIIVAEIFRRNRKITITTSPRVRIMVNLMSANDARTDADRS